MAQSPIRVGFMGGGMICQVAHLPFYLADPRCEVACIAEARPSLVSHLGGLVGSERIVSHHDELLARPDINAVVICAPRPATGPLTLEALSAGKNVLVEKPMAHTVEQAERLVRTAEVQGVLYSVGYMKRFDPGVQAAALAFAELRSSGALGSLLAARFYDYSKSYAAPIPPHVRPLESRAERFGTWPLWPEWLSDEHRDTYAWFMNAACHDVNLLKLFFPEDCRVVGAFCGSGAVGATLESEGVPVQFEVAKTAAGRWLEGGEFLFEGGRLRFQISSPMDMTGVTQVFVEAQPKAELPEAAAVGQGWSFARQAQGFIDALTGEGPLQNPGHQGLADMKLSEAIWRAIEGVS